MDDSDEEKSEGENPLEQKDLRKEEITACKVADKEIDSARR